ncbi:MAG: hypothetical protein NVSMB24_19330 [Mucilaginibacter sp.]
MKRTALIFLTSVYLLSCLGLGVNRFYCCGKLTSVTFLYGVPDKAGNKQSAGKNNCCKNEKQSFKVKDSHFNVKALSLNTLVPAIVPSFIHLDNETIAGLLNAKIVYKGNAPPGHSDIPAYTLNCAYRI